MKFALAFTILSIVASTIASHLPTKCDPISFAVKAVCSGSDLDNDSIKKVDAHPHVFTVGGDDGKNIILTLNKDCTLKDQDGRGIYLNPDTGDFGNVDPWGEQDPTKGFTIKNDYLYYNYKEGWRACPSAPNVYSLAKNDCIGGTDIRLQTFEVKPL
ncbi:uncharacterized protein PRCAT00005019001 [Priceomyces carsonii]|uniref:uncharacterized protein n=1 Tax=Priceomyces carsonii TaxID=28549 RepID=UPI002ED90AA5|nr:unnamed protein product [Priceomyces carsonii]